MAGYQTLGNVGRAQVDAGHVGNLPAPVNATRAGSAFGVALPQQRNHVGAQPSFGHRVDGLVNGFVAQADGLVHAPQCTGNLLRR